MPVFMVMPALLEAVLLRAVPEKLRNGSATSPVRDLA
jgi:hypothetical protein